MEVSQKEQATASNESHRQLAQEHSLYAQRLDTLAQKRYLSDEEKIEEVRLKKLKLKLKDEMAMLEHGYPQSVGNA
jgi:uncharacterized protein YdcH (DUF465 family)